MRQNSPPRNWIETHIFHPLLYKNELYELYRYSIKTIFVHLSQLNSWFVHTLPVSKAHTNMLCFLTMYEYCIHNGIY